MELLVWCFIIYTLVMVAWVAHYLEEWDNQYTKQFKVKYLLVLLLAPHSAIFMCSLWSFGVMIKNICNSSMVEKVLGFMNKRLF
jgi:uncharacterized membrane protein